MQTEWPGEESQATARAPNLRLAGHCGWPGMSHLGKKVRLFGAPSFFQPWHFYFAQHSTSEKWPQVSKTTEALSLLGVEAVVRSMLHAGASCSKCLPAWYFGFVQLRSKIFSKLRRPWQLQPVETLKFRRVHTFTALRKPLPPHALQPRICVGLQRTGSGVAQA